MKLAFDYIYDIKLSIIFVDQLMRRIDKTFAGLLLCNANKYVLHAFRIPGIHGDPLFQDSFHLISAPIIIIPTALKKVLLPVVNFV
jgi:hypothetical protein